eukprot:m.34376 g.34376  ORF g.34376 m.34376 type:complete len:1097 (+) comp31970_c0_seq5:478-3768(+)
MVHGVFQISNHLENGGKSVSNVVVQSRKRGGDDETSSPRSPCSPRSPGTATKTTTTKKRVIVKKVVRRGKGNASPTTTTTRPDQVNGVSKKTTNVAAAAASSSLFSELVDDTEDDFSRMFKKEKRNDLDDLDESDPMRFLSSPSPKLSVKVKSTKRSEDDAPPVPSSPPPPLPSSAPPLLPESDPPHDEVADALPKASPKEERKDVSALVGRLKCELEKAVKEKRQAMKERDELKREVEAFLASKGTLDKSTDIVEMLRQEKNKTSDVETSETKKWRKESETLKRDLEEMTEQKEMSSAKAKELADDKETLVFLRSSFQRKFSEVKDENEELGSQLAKTEQDLAVTLKTQQLQQKELEKTREEVNAMISSFEEKMNLMEVENDSLIEDIRATRASAKRYRKKCQEMEKENEQLEGELAQVKTGVGEVETLKKQLDEALSTLEKKEKDSRAEVEKVNGKMAVLRKEVAMLKAGELELKRKRNSQVKELEDALETTRAKMDTSEESNAALKLEVAELEEEKADLVKAADELELMKGTLAKVRKERRELQKKLEEREAASETVKERRLEEERLDGEMQQFREQVSSLAAEKKEMMEYIVELEGKLDQAEKERKVKASTLKKEVKELKENCRKEETRAKRLEESVDELRKEMETVEESKQDLEEQAEKHAKRHSEETEEFQKTLKELRQELNRARDEKEAAESSIRSEYEAKLTETRRKSTGLESQIAELKASRSQLERELAKLKEGTTTKTTEATTKKTKTVITLSSSEEEESFFSMSTSDEVVDVTDGGIWSRPSFQWVGKRPSPAPAKSILKKATPGSPSQSRVKIQLNQAETPSPPSANMSPVAQRKSAMESAVAASEKSPASDDTEMDAKAKKHLKVIDKVKDMPKGASSPAGRARWDQVKTAVVTRGTSPGSKEGSPTPPKTRLDADTLTKTSPGSRIASVAQKFGAGRFGGSGTDVSGKRPPSLKRSQTFTPGSRPGVKKELSKKEMLLQWCQLKTEGYRDVKITNFGRSWNNGMAFCALIHHFFPSKIAFDTLKKENKAENFELAFRVAEEAGGVSPLLEVEDMVSMEVPDWMSVMTYVSVIYSHLAARDRK